MMLNYISQLFLLKRFRALTGKKFLTLWKTWWKSKELLNMRFLVMFFFYNTGGMTEKQPFMLLVLTQLFIITSIQDNAWGDFMSDSLR